MLEIRVEEHHGELTFDLQEDTQGHVILMCRVQKHDRIHSLG